MDALELLLGCLGDDERAQVVAVRRLGRLGDPRALGPLMRVLSSPDPEARAAALWSIDRVIAALSSMDAPACAAALAPVGPLPGAPGAFSSFERLRDVALVPWLVAQLEDREFDVRSAAGWALVRLGGAAVPAVANLLAFSTGADTRQMARLVLERIPAAADRLEPPPASPTPFARGPRVCEPRGPRALSNVTADALGWRFLAIANGLNNALQSVFAALASIRAPVLGRVSRDDAGMLDDFDEAARRLCGLIREFAAAISARGSHATAVVDDGRGNRRVERVVERAPVRMRDLLNVLAIYTDLLRADDARAWAVGASDLELLGGAVQSMVRLVDELAGYARVVPQRQPGDAMRIDVAALAQRLGWRLERFAYATGLEVRVSVLEGTPPAVRGDEARFERVVENLVANAVKYTTRGSVTVDLGFEAGALTVRVADTGCGMSGDLLWHIFEADPADRAARAAKRGGDGLVGVVQMVAELGGRIIPSSTLDVGTTFEVALPVAVQA